MSQVSQTYSAEVRFPGSARWEPVGRHAPLVEAKALERLALLRAQLPGAIYRLVPCGSAARMAVAS